MTDRTVLRYRSIAARAKALADTPRQPPAALPPDAREPLRALVLDAALQLRDRVASMPGAHAVPGPSLLARLDDALDDALRPPPPPSRR